MRVIAGRASSACAGLCPPAMRPATLSRPACTCGATATGACAMRALGTATPAPRTGWARVNTFTGTAVTAPFTERLR